MQGFEFYTGSCKCCGGRSLPSELCSGSCRFRGARSLPKQVQGATLCSLSRGIGADRCQQSSPLLLALHSC